MTVKQNSEQMMLGMLGGKAASQEEEQETIFL
jgi:hypothetical protein